VKSKLLSYYHATLNAGRSSQGKAVRLSDKRVHYDKTEERSSRFLYHTKDHLA